MVAHGNELSHFVIQPGYKTTRMGEKLAYGITLRLESLIQPQAFLNTGLHPAESELVRKIGTPYVESMLAVTGSSEQTIFKAEPFYVPAFDPGGPHQVHGGDPKPNPNPNPKHKPKPEHVLSLVWPRELIQPLPLLA